MRYHRYTVYNKIFTKILDSSIWLESAQTRLVWLTLIAAMDEDGMVQFASVSNLAHRARVTKDEAEKAVACLEGPDADSSDPDHEGRRIERVPGGWLILNAAKYRNLVTRTVAKEQTRVRVARHREKKRISNGDVTVANGSVTPSEAVTEAKSKAFQPPSRGVSEGNGSDRFPTTDQSKRIASLFHRKLTTAWDEKEVVAYRKIGTVSDDDLAAIERYYKSERAKGEKGFHRRDLGTFLNNFAGELDRARAYRPFTGVTKNTIDDGRWRQFLKSLGREYEEPMRVMPFLRDDFAKWEKLQ